MLFKRNDVILDSAFLYCCNWICNCFDYRHEDEWLKRDGRYMVIKGLFLWNETKREQRTINYIEIHLRVLRVTPMTITITITTAPHNISSNIIINVLRHEHTICSACTHTSALCTRVRVLYLSTKLYIIIVSWYAAP